MSYLILAPLLLLVVARGAVWAARRRLEAARKRADQLVDALITATPSTAVASPAEASFPQDAACEEAREVQ